jgi:hypothetical protein
MKKRKLQQRIERVQIYLFLKTTHLLSFFSSSFPFGTCKQRLKRNTAKGVNTKWQSKTMPL